MRSSFFLSWSSSWCLQNVAENFSRGSAQDQYMDHLNLSPEVTASRARQAAHQDADWSLLTYFGLKPRKLYFGFISVSIQVTNYEGLCMVQCSCCWKQQPAAKHWREKVHYYLQHSNLVLDPLSLLHRKLIGDKETKLSSLFEHWKKYIPLSIRAGVLVEQFVP